MEKCQDNTVMCWTANVNVVCVSGGIQSCSGIYILDVFLQYKQRIYSNANSADVFVVCIQGCNFHQWVPAAYS